MRLTQTFFFSAVTLLGLSGCGPSEHNLSLTTDKDRYSLGAPVEVTLHNGSLSSVGYNLCASKLQRHVDGEFIEELRRTENASCNKINEGLGPLSQVSESLEMRGDLPPGEYRFVQSVHPGWTNAEGVNVTIEVASEPFHLGE
ncbi:MAG: hypothetical protein L0Y66_18255 [Myxococcaceae bacterium]|nr:hypothetical protein [Myxococcaceae bacterium]MCI0669611.1 hypothetical protein [Myxococcaceae bacterium]